MAVPHVGTLLEDGLSQRLDREAVEVNVPPPTRSGCLHGGQAVDEHTARTLHPQGPGGTAAKVGSPVVKTHASLQGSWVQPQIRGLSSHLPRGGQNTNSIRAREAELKVLLLDLTTNPALKPSAQGPYSRTESSQSNAFLLSVFVLLAKGPSIKNYLSN